MNNIENSEPTIGFPPQEHDDESPPVERLDVEPETPVDFEIAVPLGRLEEQEIVDDPVRMYLHEIGRERLLTARGEKVLARKMEEGKRIKEIKQGWLQRYGRLPSATEVFLTMLKELSQALTIIHFLQKELSLTPKASFLENICDAGLRERIDGEIDQHLIQAIASQIGKSLPETEQLFINLSLNSSLLPEEVLNAIGDSVSLADMENLVTEPE